jgi:L,D-transpeptidase catalytic domain
MYLKRRAFGTFLLSGVATALGVNAASGQRVQKYAEQLKNGEFNWFPERSSGGPILVIVSIPDQLVHVYRNGIRVAASTCATGKPGHETPTGVFKILQKDKHHKSSTYNNAPMPNMNRLTWSGIALHAGNLPGYPASHGCVRLPLAFSELLFGITRLGMTVVIANEHSHPQSVVHPGLILGDYAKKEYRAVDATLLRAAYSEGRSAHKLETSIVVSKRNNSMTIFDGGNEIHNGKVDFSGNHKIVDDSVYVLANSDTAGQGLHWIAVNHGKKNLTAGRSYPLRDIRAKPEFHERVRKSLHPGATLVVTEGDANPKTRSSNGFVVFDGLY